MEIHQVSRIAALALVTRAPAGAFVEEARADGSLELWPAPGLVDRIETHSGPALVVAPRFPPELVRSIRDRGLEAPQATTFEFGLNLLLDRWTPVLLEARIPALENVGAYAFFERIDARHAVILADALSGSPSGIIHSLRPTNAAGFVSLFERMTENRVNPCGMAEHPGRQHRVS